MFHETLFPLDISIAASGGPERKTEIVTLASGFEERNARWADSRRRYEAGYGIKTIAVLNEVLAFFEERRGRLHGFRFRDRLDNSSSPLNALPTALDQPLGLGDGTKTTFHLTKTYGSAFNPYTRDIKKPVIGSVLIAINGTSTTAFTTNPQTGEVTFATAPASGETLTAGFRFDVPVRFDTDRLDVNLTHFTAGKIPHIPLIEIRV